MHVESSNSLTVVIPTFNRSDELVRALDSLVAQTDSDFDVIVCDDGSTADIASAIQAFRHRLRLKLTRIDNSGGPARPRNIGTQAATTTWISYLDSDDWWFPSRIAQLKSQLKDDCDLVYHTLLVDRSDRCTSARPSHGSTIGEPIRVSDPLLHMIRFGNPLPTSGTTVRRDWMLRIGGFDESRDLASVEDFDAWIRLATQGARLRHIPEALGAYWIGHEHISTFNARQFERQRNLFQKQLTLLPSAYRARAESNFSYLLGSYALALGLPNAGGHLRKVRLRDEPVRWLKAQAKLINAFAFRARPR